MKYTLKYMFLVFGLSFCFYAQGQIYVSGFVEDSLSGERLIGATVMDLQTKKGEVTDQQGFFSLRVAIGSKLRISFVGFQRKEIMLGGTKDTLLQIHLNPTNTLSTVEVRASSKPKFNVAKLSTQEIMQIPHISGKPDVLKALQFIPGIRAQGEMSSVTLVRGGNPGENLYLIDQTPLIYVHHIGGFMSVFNPDMINDVEVYKGSFPAKYGERLSSIMNISQKEGNKSGFQGSVSVGLTDIGLTLEGPTKLKKSSFIVTGRKTLTELPYLLASSLGSSASAYLIYGFHDINGKFSWSPNQRNSLHFNIYQGDDYLQQWSKPNNKFGNEEKFKVGNLWGNWLVATNWKHVYSSKLFFNNTLAYTNYRLRNTNKIESADYQSKQVANSGVQDVSVRSDARYLVFDNWNMDFGGKVSYLLFTPISLSGDNIKGQVQDHVNSMEATLYWDNKIQLLEKLDLNLGLRWANYLTKDFYNSSIEPRLAINYNFMPQQNLNLSYMRVSQNAQLLYNVGSLSANEIYVPSGKSIPVAFSDQVCIGWGGEFMQNQLQIELNVYYKILQNLTSYKEGYNYNVGDLYWREKLETGGKGEAAGVELFIKKTQGKWTGFAGYTYAKTIRQYANINGGKAFPFEYDSPHNISLSLAYQISNKWSVGLVWQYQSGLPYTPAIGRYSTIGQIDMNGDYRTYEVLIYGKKNSARMRAYHRLDFAFKYTNYTKKRHRKYEWSLGLYNAYNRQNPYYYYYNNNASGEIYNPKTWSDFKNLNLYQVSMFPIMPMASYKIWFGANSGQTPKPVRSKEQRKEERLQKSKNWFFYE